MYSREKIIDLMKEIYEGSKEIAPYVVIAQPRRIKGEVAAQKLDGYSGIHIDLLGISHGFCDIYGEKVDVARNYLIEQALQSGAKYLFFVGEDTVIPYDGFKKLWRTAEENPNSIVTGVYYIKLSNAMIMVKEKNWISIPNVDPGQLIEAWMTGMDCMLIPIELLQQMKDEEPELPFCCIGNNIDGIPFIGEDNFFIHRVHKKGIKLLVNTDVQCLHVDLASGKYTAHPSVDLRNYFTNIKITEPLTMEDKKYIDDRWLNRLPEGSNSLESKIEKLKSENKPVKFNMGCGPDILEDYINVDNNNISCEVKKDILDFELPKECADEIFASHVIEHFHYAEFENVMINWFNGLKTDGKLILETPNLEKLCEEFKDASEERRFLLTLCIYGAFANHMSPEAVRNGTASPHLWGYYPSLTKEILEKIGFKSVEIMEQQGKHPGHNFRIEAIK